MSFEDLKTNENIGERSRLSQTNTVSFIYQWKDRRPGDIFTPKNLRSICMIESKVFNSSLYKDYCYLKNNNCSDIFTSVSNVFYPEDHNWQCDLLSTQVVNSKKDLMYNDIKDNQLSSFGFFVEKISYF